MNPIKEYLNQQLKSHGFHQITLATWETIPETILTIKYQKHIYSITQNKQQINTYYLNYTKETPNEKSFGWERIATHDLANPNTDPQQIIETITNHITQKPHEHTYPNATEQHSP
jgi:hypothetical protein